MSKKGPPSKRNNPGGLSQENKPTEDASAESPPSTSAPGERPRRKRESHRRGSSQKGETALDPSEQDGVAPTQQTVKETHTHQGTSQTRESSIQRDSASRQRARKRHPQKHGGAPQNSSPAAAQEQVSAEEQGSWKGRLWARGSQSSKV